MLLVYSFQSYDKGSAHLSGDGLSSVEVFLFASIPFVLAIGALLFTWFRKGGEFWKEDGFPSDFKYSDKNYAKILLAFGCVISSREEEYVLREKLSWIKNYLSKSYGGPGFDIMDSYERIISKGINIQRLVAWGNKHLDPSKKVVLLEFVIQLANTDHSINPREAEFIFYLLSKLKVNLDSLSQSVQDMLMKEEKELQLNQKKNSGHYFEVLGLSENATSAQIKSAYRKLVKIHHPDNHRKLTETERKEHVARFLEIQQAYEIISAGMA